jgi:hypothetical protein
MAVELKNNVVFGSKECRFTEKALCTAKIRGDRKDEQNKHT